MQYKRVLLVKFTMKVGYGPRRPPVGLGYIAEALKLNKIEYDVVDCDLGYDLEEILRKGRTFKPDLIGINMLTLGYIESYEKIRIIKEELKCDIVLGGAHISTLREPVMEACSSIDYGIVGEGDFSIIDLCKGKSLKDIPGLIYRQNSEIIFNGVVPPIHDLDQLGFPTYMNFELDQYFGNQGEVSLVTTRGCPFGCTYCSVRLIMGPRMRFRSARNVTDEIEYWVHRGYKLFAIMDDNFSHNRDRVFEICDEIERRGLDIRISLANGLRADRTDYEMLKRLRDVGAFEIQIGVESANDHILKRLKKGEDLATIERSVQDAIQLGYDVGTCFLVGSPGETIQDVENSFDFVKRHSLTRTFFFNIIPYPGTALFDYLKDNNLLLDDPENYLGTLQQNEVRPVFETPEISLKERIRLLRKSRKVAEGVRYRFLVKRFKKFFIFAEPMAFFASWHVTEPFLKRSRFFSQFFLNRYYELREREKQQKKRNQNSL